MNRVTIRSVCGGHVPEVKSAPFLHGLTDKGFPAQLFRPGQTKAPCQHAEGRGAGGHSASHKPQKSAPLTPTPPPGMHRQYRHGQAHPADWSFAATREPTCTTLGRVSSQLQ